MVDVIDRYARFALPRHWGGGRAAIADGTHVTLRENNLLGARYIRYGGIAYHHAATTKIEAYNDFLDWVSFGGPVIKIGDPVGQEKQPKYASPVANAVMLSNLDDLTRVLSDRAADGHLVTPALVAFLSPYMRRHILRFGRYALDMDNLPEPLSPQPLPFENAL